jgi:Flp pilus assembly protein TadG
MIRLSKQVVCARYRSRQSAVWQVGWWRLLRGLAKSNQGVAGVEFAILAPILVLMMICTADVALGIYYKMRIQNAAQYGAQYAIAHGFDSASVAAAISATNSVTGLSVTPAPYQFCGCPTSDGIAGADCTSTCPDGSSPGLYVTVSTEGTYQTLLPYPLLANNYTFNSQATVRFQ